MLATVYKNEISDVHIKPIAAFASNCGNESVGNIYKRPECCLQVRYCIALLIKFGLRNMLSNLPQILQTWNLLTNKPT
jgi:hypothetical protein